MKIKTKYKLKDIVQIYYKKNVLGRYKNEEVILKNGKYGLYVTVGGKNVSIKTDKTEDEITLEDVIPFLQSGRSIK